MQYDIIIVGGGLVGASLALALHNTALQIALIEARATNHDDQRLFALNDSSCQLLKNINVWDEIKQFASPIHQVHVSHRGHFGSVKLNCQAANLSSLGYVIPVCHLEHIFNLRLKSQANLTIYQPARVKKISQHHGQACINLEDASHEIHGAIVIAADGADSTVRTQLDIPTDYYDYQQSAIVTRTTLQRSHQQIAYERFTKKGAIAMLPLLNNECATIWSGATTEMTTLMAMDDQEFLQQLQSQFGYRLGRLCSVNKRHIFPLRMLTAKKIVDGCIFLLGNAAHSLHPIAAQGFNLALYEVATLVENIKLASEKNQIVNLQLIQENTEIHRNRSVKLSHRLSEIFSKQSILLHVVLHCGMAGLDIASPLKLRFIRSIMGRINNVPRLLLNASEL